MKCTALTVVVLVASLLPACAGSKEARTTTTVTAPSTVPKRDLRVVRIAEVDPGAGRVASVITWDHFVAWVGASTVSSGIEGEPNQVLVHDLETKTTRVVARTGFPKGTINRVRAHRDTLVYVDQQRVTTDSEPGTSWHMYAFSLTTGELRRLASSRSPADENDPARPSIAWPWVAWLQSTGDEEGHVAVRRIHLETGQEKVLVPSTAAGQFSMDDVTGTVFYDDDNGAGGRDVFRVPADGSMGPTKVTSSGKADFPIARNGGLVWQQPPGSDSDSLWYRPLPEGTETKFALSSAGGIPAGTNSFPGRGFVVWSDGKGLNVAYPMEPPRPAVLVQDRTSLSIGARWWVDGQRLVWATVKGYGDDERSLIHLASVVE